MREQRLLERIAGLEAGNAHPHATRAQVLVASIRDYLQRILNTRQGSVPIDPEFGVPDFTNIAGSFSKGTTREIIESLTHMIERYEPRLKSPRITLGEAANEVLTLSFSLDGLIAVDDRDVPVRLMTAVSPSGRVSLKTH